MGRPAPAKVHLVAAGIPQRVMAARVGVSPTWLTLVLNGHRQPSEQLKLALARELGLPPELLFRDVVEAAA